MAGKVSPDWKRCVPSGYGRRTQKGFA